MKITILLLAFTLISGFVTAQQKPDPSIQKPVITSAKDDLNWYDLQKQQSPILQGVGWNEELKGTFGRLPLRAKEKVRPDVWGLSENCAGITVRFRTNAPEIKVAYQVSCGISFPHMTSTG